MPRIARKNLKTSFFHVITQGINKSYIFENSEDIKYYIKTMYKLLENQNIKILAYCIMNNHAHILLEIEKINQLSKYMHRLNTNYGMYYNKKYKRVGYVFKDRYKSEGIYSEKHLYNCINYIYNNPVKAGICNKPEEYLYSNYKKIDKKLKEEYVFIDIDEENEKRIKDMIKKFLTENNIDFIDLKKNKIKLEKLILELKEKNNVSLRKISTELGINRETIRRIYNK